MSRTRFLVPVLFGCLVAAAFAPGMAMADCVSVGGLTRCTDGNGTVSSVNHVGGAGGGETQAVTTTGQGGSSTVNNIGTGNVSTGPAVTGSSGVVPGSPAIAPNNAAAAAPTIPGTNVRGTLAPSVPPNAIGTGTGAAGVSSTYSCGPGGCTGTR